MKEFAELLGIGAPELIVVLAIVLLLFGSKKLPELAKSLGTSARELRKGLNEDDADAVQKAKSSDAKTTTS
ncbi:MAG TPA: twin-arginine translocase TatA/TatE family subunit [Candidatus Saccharimonadales bacterium]|nr:twin-arginine translocase TatA/TatE family subunit [Candidatus Saccharimonadales bacterium]